MGQRARSANSRALTIGACDKIRTVGEALDIASTVAAGFSIPLVGAVSAPSDSPVAIFADRSALVLSACYSASIRWAVR